MSHPPSSPLPAPRAGRSGTGPRSTPRRPGSGTRRSRAPGRAATPRSSCRRRCV